METQQPTGESPESSAQGERRLFLSSVLAIAWVVFPPLAGTYILLRLGSIAEFLSKDIDNGWWGYVAVFALTSGLGLLPTYSQSFLGGWVFGLKWGLLGAILGFTGGAAIGYLFARFVTGTSVDRWIDRHPKGRVIRDALARGSAGRTILIITLLRLPPNSPFAITNLAFGATRVPFWQVMVATPIGMLPRTAVACLLASQIASVGAEDIATATEKSPTPVWLWVAGVLVSIAVLGVISRVANLALSQLSGGASTLRLGGVIGGLLFSLYLIGYSAFVAAAAFDTFKGGAPVGGLAAESFAGVPWGIAAGMALILGAFVLAVIYAFVERAPEGGAA